MSQISWCQKMNSNSFCWKISRFAPMHQAMALLIQEISWTYYNECLTDIALNEEIIVIFWCLHIYSLWCEHARRWKRRTADLCSGFSWLESANHFDNKKGKWQTFAKFGWIWRGIWTLGGKFPARLNTDKSYVLVAKKSHLWRRKNFLQVVRVLSQYRRSQWSYNWDPVTILIGNHCCHSPPCCW